MRPEVITMYHLDGLTVGNGATVGAAAREAWRDWCCQAHGRLDFEFDVDDYRARLLRQRTSAYQLIAWTGDAEVITRRARDVRRDSRGHYELIVPLSGDLHIGRDDRLSLLRPGEMILVSIDVPFKVAHPADAAALTLIIPPERIEHRLGPYGIRGHRMFGGKGLGRVSRELIVSLLGERDHLSGSDFDAACDRVVDLICLARDGADRPPTASAGATVVQQVRRYIRKHATDPNLSITAIASAVGWSARYIQTVLAREGTTPTQLIRGERLGLARVRLSDPALANKTIAAIAASVGFTSPSAFSHAYRKHFGCSPRETRGELRTR
ncbi:AraC family transcriptional regulator [Amycolatopsis taiwanensis]|uniref:AraC family transcriptional regulator n=1 Tax=Amycolatopsis taiwanensis TaxID=342230 RepID=UPI0004B83575|nr:AraC family transcriptional regulator [Amycolatopsis taiwanensis]